MTESAAPERRAYYFDSYTRAFTARVVERLTFDARPAVVLDKTCFYPSSGGQPFDKGTINGSQVVDVVVRPADGAILHVLAGEISGEEARGEVDWARRFDHMQQHTGQHILSQAFVREANAETVSFHLGAD
ncbi:MAG: alanyl-tRNA editing protein, partial [Chloroflexi bacterium]|nr:alanyl-tRNA editing protein [Chloroflexota bacterium]